ncbi:MAG: ADP-ribosylglycohydrolase family protein [Coriobacteriia bacterium]|nr:ADP-ribosylglycohydrolase family protein [Coriobacteriia bacterium]
MSKDQLLDKFTGCIIGGAAGDALGYAVEFISMDRIRTVFGSHGIRAYVPDPARGVAVFSDDTQMTLFTAAGVSTAAAKDQLTVEGIASACGREYQDWLHTQDPGFKRNPGESWLLDIPELHVRRAPGCTCMSALEGQLGSTTRLVNNSKGCGGVMRVAPVGLISPSRTGLAAAEHQALLVQAAAECAALTHGHPLGFISAGAFAYIVHRCAYEVPADCVDRRESLRAIINDCCDQLPDWFPQHPEHAAYQVELLQRACTLADDRSRRANKIAQLGEGWVGEEALAIAVYAALKHVNSFADAICTAVNHSGDSDSTGSICGNILGAMLGSGRIGSKWTADLELVDVLTRAATDLHSAVS